MENLSIFYMDKKSLRYGILVLCLERSKIVVFRTAEKHGIYVLDLEHSNSLPRTRGFYI